MLEQNQIILRRRVNKRYLWRTNCKTDRGRKKTSADFVSPRRIKQFASTKQKIPSPRLMRNYFFVLHLREMKGSKRRGEERHDFRLASSNS